MVVASRVASAVAANCAHKRNGGAGQSFKGGNKSFSQHPPAKTPAELEEEKRKKEEEMAAKPLHRRLVGMLLDFLDQTWLQTLMYLIFLFTFQSLTGTIRKSEEFYFDKYLTDTFINNPFDADHNRFMDVRRIADIWEWKKNVLVPGLFSQSPEGEFWPDGDGLFSVDGATPYSTYDIVEADNFASFTQGIVFKQTRAAPLPASLPCYSNHTCYGPGDGVTADGNGGDRTAYGYGAMQKQFKYWTSADLGANPAGTGSASQLSYRSFSSGGFVALFLPFFSDVALPSESGPYDQVQDHRVHEATPSNQKVPKYYCARSSYNGYHIEQRCNPTPSANTAVARHLMEEMLDGMKKGHWVDHRTRLLSITMQMRNNNAGVRFVARYMFEITQMGAVLPSYDMETYIDDEDNTNAQKLWMLVALGLTTWFAVLEGVELLQTGPVGYFTNAWNVMDWTNFALFAMCYLTLQQSIDLNVRDQLPASDPNNPCKSKICMEFGFYDVWEVMDTARNAKLFMSICVTIQLLKIVKFTNVIVPKMSLMTRVLSKGCYDLLFFGIIFAVSMFAFSMLFFIQLGSFMDDFFSITSSFVALAKALFGDFPFDEIIDNSRGYTNGILFLVYLFVAVFILLSMFLAILGEAQAAVRDEENSQKERGEFPNQYGFLDDARDMIGKVRIPWQRPQTTTEIDEEAEAARLAAEKQARQDENPGLDQALNMALERMQRKLDASVNSRMTGLETRVLNKLAGLESRYEGTGRTGKGGGGGGGGGSRERTRSFERSKSESPTKLMGRQCGNNRSEAKLVDAPGMAAAGAAGRHGGGDSRSHSRGGYSSGEGRAAPAPAARRPPNGRKDERRASVGDGIDISPKSSMQHNGNKDRPPRRNSATEKYAC